jgi:hypothetical protein
MRKLGDAILLYLLQKDQFEYHLLLWKGAIIDRRTSSDIMHDAVKGFAAGRGVAYRY